MGVPVGYNYQLLVAPIPPLKFLADFFPVILFFVAYKVSDIYVATGVAIAATVLQIGYSLVRRHKVSGMQWTSLVIIGLFGGATLLLHDETFIKWKPTVLYWLFGAVLAGGMLGFRKNLIRTLLGEQMRLPDPIWARLNWSWVAFFCFMGAANLYVAYNYSTDLWVNFKLFGGIGLMIAFVVAQSLVLAKYLQDEQ